MEYIYPAIFELNSDGSYTITFPDLPGCISEGKSLGNAIDMAQSALTQWIEYLLEEKENIREPSNVKMYEHWKNKSNQAAATAPPGCFYFTCLFHIQPHIKPVLFLVAAKDIVPVFYIFVIITIHTLFLQQPLKLF